MVHGVKIEEENALDLLPDELLTLMQEREVEPVVLSSVKAEAMVQVYWWAIQACNRQHEQHSFTLAHVQQLVRVILDRSPDSGGAAGWCTLS